MKHSTVDLLGIIHNFYPPSMWPDEAGYSETPQDRRLMEATRAAGTGADYERWKAMLDRLRATYPAQIHDTSLHLTAAERSPCYEAICRLKKTEDEDHHLGVCVSFLAPYYLIHSWHWTRARRRPQVRFELDEAERPYAQGIADEIEATYGFE